MTACIDDERREVAERLRELDYSDLQESLICAYLDALGIKGYEDWIGIAHRLADLIEPSCDREALLALADEMVAIAGTYPKKSSTSPLLLMFARRIREACGVVG